MFYHNLSLFDDALYLMNQVFDVNIALDEQLPDKVLGVPTQGIRYLKDECGSEKFLRHISILDDLNVKLVTKKFLKKNFNFCLSWLQGSPSVYRKMYYYNWTRPIPNGIPNQVQTHKLSYYHNREYT